MTDETLSQSDEGFLREQLSNLADAFLIRKGHFCHNPDCPLGFITLALASLQFAIQKERISVETGWAKTDIRAQAMRSAFEIVYHSPELEDQVLSMEASLSDELRSDN